MKKRIFIAFIILLLAFSLALPVFSDTYSLESYHSTDGSFSIVPYLVCLGIGLVIALIAVSVMRSKLKSVRKDNFAGKYMVGGSFQLTDSRDIFLYHTVTRVAKPKNNGSSGKGRNH